MSKNVLSLSHFLPLDLLLLAVTRPLAENQLTDRHFVHRHSIQYLPSIVRGQYFISLSLLSCNLIKTKSKFLIIQRSLISFTPTNFAVFYQVLCACK